MVLESATLSYRHVRLEPLTLGHVAGLWKAAQDVGDTGLLTSVPLSESETRQYVMDAVAAQVAGAAQPFAIMSMASGELVGTTRLATFEYWNWGRQARPVRPGPDALEIGWTWLAEKAQRSAINTEAKWLLLNYAFETLLVERVLIKTDARNVRSRAAIERIGGTFEGVFRRHAPAADGGVRDTAIYSIIAPEWATVKAALRAKLEREGPRRS